MKSAFGVSFKMNPFVLGIMFFDFKYMIGIQILFLCVYIITDKEVADRIIKETEGII